MAERLELFSDVTLEERRKQPPCLIESRHDQSVFSALAYRCLAKPETRRRILARWEHVENLDVFFSQVIRATRWPGESPYRPSLRDRISSSVRRFLKDFIWKPFIACPVQRAAERRNGIL